MDWQALKIAGMESIAAGRRTPEFDRLLLEALSDEDARRIVRAALAVKPNFTAGELQEACAAAFVRRYIDEYPDRDAAIRDAARIYKLSEETVAKAARGARPPVNAILKSP